MAAEETTKSRFYVVNPSDKVSDEIEERFFESVPSLEPLLAKAPGYDVSNEIASKAELEKGRSESISLGLVAITLTDDGKAKYISPALKLLMRDHHAYIVAQLSALILERYGRLLEKVRAQLIWLLKEFISWEEVPNVESLCIYLSRHAAGGDLSKSNVWLIDNLLSIFEQNRKWLLSVPWLPASVVYTFLRLIEDHMGQAHAALRRREVDLVISLMRERFNECASIGRDLIRLLINIARVNEIEQLWKDIINNPKKLSPAFAGLSQILEQRTSRRYLQLRLTPDMEKKIVFLTSNVRFGSEKRYQDWIRDKYLATPESQTLRSDWIRFIVGVVHPTNELLCSEIIPRWAIIGWLITSCNAPIALSNAKLSLFYDWLFFDPKVDNIMNIEPAILVVSNSIKLHPSIAACLLDFLCVVTQNFYPPLEARIRKGVSSAFGNILDKKVVSSLAPLFTNVRLDSELRFRMRTIFPQFYDPPCTPPVAAPPVEYQQEEGNANVARIGVKIEPPGNRVITTKKLPPPNILKDFPLPKIVEIEPRKEPLWIVKDENNVDLCPEFSDDDEDDPVAVTPPKLNLGIYTEQIRDPQLSNPAKKNFTAEESSNILSGMKPDLRMKIADIGDTSQDMRKRCNAVDDFVKIILSDVNACQDSTSSICAVLNCSFSGHLGQKYLPEMEEPDRKTLQRSTNTPVFRFFRHIAETKSDNTRRILLRFLARLLEHDGRYGYLFLYYATTIGTNDISECFFPFFDKTADIYKEVCDLCSKRMEISLLEDLECCRENDRDMFFFLIPPTFRQFPKILVHNERMIKSIVSSADYVQIQTLVSCILQGDTSLIDKRQFSSMLDVSLEWDTLEQISFWQLSLAHGISGLDAFNAFIKHDFRNHAEATCHILLMLRAEHPTEDLLKVILNREIHIEGDFFVESILRAWCNKEPDNLGEALAQLLNSRRAAINSEEKRIQGSGEGRSEIPSQGDGCIPDGGQPSTERVLGHLRRYKLALEAAMENESLLKALAMAQEACTDEQKDTFAELFAMSADIEKRVSSRKQMAKIEAEANNETISSSSDEERGKKKAKEKRNSSSSDCEDDEEEEEDDDEEREEDGEDEVEDEEDEGEEEDEDEEDEEDEEEQEGEIPKKRKRIGTLHSDSE